MFPSGVISHNGDIAWPLRSPFSTPLDSFLWVSFFKKLKCISISRNRYYRIER